MLKLGDDELRVAATEYAELAGRVARIFNVRDPYAVTDPSQPQRCAG